MRHRERESSASLAASDEAGPVVNPIKPIVASNDRSWRMTFVAGPTGKRAWSRLTRSASRRRMTGICARGRPEST